MGWKFRKSIKVLPGIRVNVSSRGVSGVRLGPRNAGVSFSSKGTTISSSIPKTGLSHSHFISAKTKNPRGQQLQTFDQQDDHGLLEALPDSRDASMLRTVVYAAAFVGFLALCGRLLGFF